MEIEFDLNSTWLLTSQHTLSHARSEKAISAIRGRKMDVQKRHQSMSSAGDGLFGGGSLPGGREQLGKFGGSCMILAAGAALTYFIYVAAQGAPAPHVGEPPPRLIYPLWPFYLCAGILTAGSLLYGWAHRWRLPRWETRRALRRRATEAETRATEAETALAAAEDALEAARNAASAQEQEPEPLRLLLVEVISYRQW